MPALSQVTVTAKDGPAQTVTAQVVTDVSRIDFQVGKNGIVQITSGGVIKEYDIAATATLTATISSGVITMVINQ
jgi:hypothetical protein